jgi:microcin C transport system substrate-binding protein
MTRWLPGKCLAAGIAASALLGIPPLAAEEFRHGLSTFGDLKYPADFRHFDYVNPDAPKGGRFSTYGGPPNSFDSFNPFILKGDSATGLTMLFDTLMERSGDEPDAMYGVIAKEVAVTKDGKGVTFRLRPEAKFSDGSAITSADVVFSFETLKAKGPWSRWAVTA